MDGCLHAPFFFNEYIYLLSCTNPEPTLFAASSKYMWRLYLLSKCQANVIDHKPPMYEFEGWGEANMYLRFCGCIEWLC